MKVLIVDDNAADRKLLRLNLEWHGCETVIEACDGQEGLALAREHRPDLIISDAMMPRLDGYELLRRLKTDSELSKIPFVFHSAVYIEGKDEELAFRIGAEACITKPAEPEGFWREIVAILKRGSAGNKKPASCVPIENEREYHLEHSGVVAEKLTQTVKELQERVEELQKFYDMAVGRELKMKELKKEIEQLKKELSSYKKGP